MTTKENPRTRIPVYVQIGDGSHDKIMLGSLSCGAEGFEPYTLAALFRAIANEVERQWRKEDALHHDGQARD